MTANTAVRMAVRTSCAFETQRIWPDEQVLQVLAAVRVVREQQDLRRRRRARTGCRSAPPAPRAASSRSRSGATRPRAPRRRPRPARVQPSIGKPKPLAAITPSPATCAIARSMNTMPRAQHLLAERHVRDHDQEARDQRRPEDAEIGAEKVHLTAASSLLIVSSKRPKRSFASGVPPTENGSTTTGAWTRSDSQLAAFGSL